MMMYDIIINIKNVVAVSEEDALLKVDPLLKNISETDYAENTILTVKEKEEEFLKE